jgi:predicted  nucleic acid-binding Zn-ribbon protein
MGMNIDKDNRISSLDKSKIDILNEFNWDIEQLIDEIISQREDLDEKDSEIENKEGDIEDKDSEIEKLESEISDLEEQVGLCTQCEQLKNLAT